MLRYSTELKPLEEIYFLEFTIRNTGDGLVLSKTKYDPTTELWMCHLGNYATIKNAKHAAIVFWMISRLAEFHHTMLYKMMNRGGCMGEYHTFKQSVEKAGYKLPEEVGFYDGHSFILTFDGVRIEEYWDKNTVN